MELEIEATAAVTPAEAAPAPQKAPKKRRGKKKWIALIIIAAIIAAAVIFVRPIIARYREAASGLSSSYVTDVVTRRDISSSLSGSGTLRPADSYSVTTLIEGEIITAEFEEGDVVEKDTELYKIDSSNTSSSLERAELSLASARNAYNRQLENLEKLEITASASGYITSLDIEYGDSVTGGQPMISIVDSRYMTIELPFLTDDAADIRVGQAAEVTLDGSFETLPGRVTKLGGADIVLSGNVVARYVTIEVENPGAISPSLTATAGVGDAVAAGAGTFKYKSEKTVSAELSGDVAAIAVSEGDYVFEGQRLVSLTSDSLSDAIDNAYRQLRDAEIAMENQTDQLDNYTIKSPINGTVISKDYKQGDTLSAGKVLCTIYDLTYLQMTMNIDELDIKKIEVGQSVDITADAVEGRAFAGVVTKISIQGATANGVTSYPVTVRIDDAGELLPGMNVDAEIVFQSAENVLSVPIGAVARGNRVLVKTVGGEASDGETPPSDIPQFGGTPPSDFPQGDIPQSQAPQGNIPQGNIPQGGGAGQVNISQGVPDGYEYVAVETGVSDGTYIEIKSGLREGDEITYVRQAESQNMFVMMPGGMGMGGGMTGGGTMTVTRGAGAAPGPDGTVRYGG
ncbi:MAG: efflux RND transporter periplasmic adaptor subunit [Oscillospiraceae bacterium]|jgi:HlyD family secretion protein|nr:efflux RND transporter periplasmic adaptor subunit [Oscillospiraceae bacterium]